MGQLELRIEELRKWLHSIEIQLAAPVILEQCTQQALDKALAQHEVSLFTMLTLTIVPCIL